MHKRVTVEQAIELLEKNIDPLFSEHVMLEHAFGRVLRQPVISDRPLPPYDRVMMDGIAIKLKKGSTEWTISGEQFAGDQQERLENENTCIEVMTGAILPWGADTVIPVEDYVIKKQQVFLNHGVNIRHRQFVHHKESISRANETLLQEGALLDGKTLALCASVGMTDLTVSKKPRVAFISTGNELISPYETPNMCQIRRSNDHLIAAELRKLGIKLETNIHLEDERETILNHIKELNKNHDLILFSGGVSKGKADFIPTCAWEAGFEMIYHGVAQKPGGPMLAAKHSNGCILMGLPGNPMSSLVCTRLYLRVALKNLTGYPIHKRKIKLNKFTKSDFPKSRLLPVKLATNKASHEENADVIYPHTSGDLLTVVETDGMVHIPIDCDPNKETYFDYFDWSL